LKSKVTAPFAAVTKKKLRQTAQGRTGSAIGNGRPVSVKSKPGAVRRPAATLAPKPPRRDNLPVRDAQLVLARIEPWSVMKFSFMLSLVGFVVLIVAVSVFYFLFSTLGVFHSIEHTFNLVTTVKGPNGTTGSNAANWFSAGTVLGYTAFAGAVDVILITALTTFGAVIYNLVTRVSGGIEITLQEAD